MPRTPDDPLFEALNNPAWKQVVEAMTSGGLDPTDFTVEQLEHDAEIAPAEEGSFQFGGAPASAGLAQPEPDPGTRQAKLDNLAELIGGVLDARDNTRHDYVRDCAQTLAHYVTSAPILRTVMRA